MRRTKIGRYVNSRCNCPKIERDEVETAHVHKPVPSPAHGRVTDMVRTPVARIQLLGRGKGNVKVNLSLCFNSAPGHEGVLREWRYSSTHSLTSALDGSE
jgi:hypothetical protein